MRWRDLIQISEGSGNLGWMDGWMDGWGIEVERSIYRGRET